MESSLSDVLEQENTLFTDLVNTKNDENFVKPNDCTQEHIETMKKLGLKKMENIQPEWVPETDIKDSLYEQM